MAKLDNQIEREINNTEFSLKLIERDERNDKSIWEVKLEQDCHLIDGGNGCYIPKGTTFKGDWPLEDTEDEVWSNIRWQGIVKCFGITREDYERVAECETYINRNKKYDL